MIDVPNKPKTPHLAIRVPRELQDQVKAKAAARGETVTAALIRMMERYVKSK